MASLPTIPLDLRPGLYKNGTRYAGRSRWADSNLVRWMDGKIVPVGGWERRIDVSGQQLPVLFGNSATESVRQVKAWTSTAGGRHVAFATNRAVYYLSPTGVVRKITPSDAPTAPVGASTVEGYSVGRYGRQSYGTRRTGASLQPDPPRSWRIAHWGDDLLLALTGDGPLYHWALGSAEAVPVIDAPADTREVIVTDERIVMVFGNSTDSRLVLWSDSENFNDWDFTTATNQAGFKRLEGSGKFMASAKVLDQVLILSELDAHAAVYLGPPYIYGFKRVGEQCGIISSNALAATDTLAIWPGERTFWVFDGQVRPLQSEVIDFFIADRDPTELGKTSAVHLSDYDEIWWFYQSKDSPNNAPDKYIGYNYTMNYWTKGVLARTAGIDKGATRTPIMVAPNGAIFNHEVLGAILPESHMPFVETGPFEIARGEVSAHIPYILPDAENCDRLEVVIKARDMPQMPERQYGPYALTSPTKVRARGREVAFKFSGTGDWRIGSMRAMIVEGSGR